MRSKIEPIVIKSPKTNKSIKISEGEKGLIFDFKNFQIGGRKVNFKFEGNKPFEDQIDSVIEGLQKSGIKIPNYSDIENHKTIVTIKDDFKKLRRNTKHGMEITPRLKDFTSKDFSIFDLNTKNQNKTETGFSIKDRILDFLDTYSIYNPSLIIEILNFIDIFFSKSPKEAPKIFDTKKENLDGKEIQNKIDIFKEALKSGDEGTYYKMAGYLTDPNASNYEKLGKEVLKNGLNAKQKKDISERIRDDYPNIGENLMKTMMQEIKTLFSSPGKEGRVP